MNETEIHDNLSSTESVTSRIADGVDLYVPPVLVCVGLTCNVLVVMVMRTSYFSHVSTSLYITVNACVDNVSLTVALPVHWLHVNFPHVIYRGPNSDVICKLINFIGWSSSDLGIVLTAAMTFERAFAIKNPLKAPYYCTVQKAKYVIAGLFIFVILKDGFMIFYSTIVDLDIGSHLCTFDTSDKAFRFFAEKIFPVLHNVVLVASFIVVSISNVIIITSVRQSGRFPSYSTRREGSQHDVTGNRSSNGSTNNNNNNNNNSSTSKNNNKNVLRSTRSSNFKGKQLTIMLISDSLTIVICTLPFAIFTGVKSNISSMDADVDHLVFAVTFYLLYINRCANFFLYCTSGEKFRMTLRNLCRRVEERRLSVFAVQIGNNYSQTSLRRSSDSTERQTLSD